VPAIYPPEFRRSLWSLRRRIASDPLGFLQQLASAPDDIVPFSLAGRPAFLLKHPDDVEGVLVAHHHKFVKADGLQRAARLLGDGLLTAEGESHRRRRSVVQPAFHRQQLDRYAAIMVRHAVGVRDGWTAGQSIDAGAEAGALTLAIVGEALFDADVTSLSGAVRDAIRTASDALDPLISLIAPSRRVRQERQRLLRVIDDLIGRHQPAAGRPDGLLSLLLAGSEATISAEVRDDALTILLAGHDTVASAMVWTWILLAQHPQADARLAEEVGATLGTTPAGAADIPALPFARAVLAESLRLRPPAWVIARSAIADHDIHGIRVPAGALVLISPFLMHRDPRFYPDPAAFAPDRWLDDRQARRPKMAFLPFGAGPRSCIGENFAWTEGVLLAATFAQRWRLSIEEPQTTAPRPKITLRPPPDLRLLVHERRSTLVSPAG
jgi:cytochrome P450